MCKIYTVKRFHHKSIETADISVDLSMSISLLFNFDVHSNTEQQKKYLKTTNIDAYHHVVNGMRRRKNRNAEQRKNKKQRTKCYDINMVRTPTRL